MCAHTVGLHHMRVLLCDRLLFDITFCQTGQNDPDDSVYSVHPAWIWSWVFSVAKIQPKILSLCQAVQSFANLCHPLGGGRWSGHRRVGST
jgi:hypothetical protein